MTLQNHTSERRLYLLTLEVTPLEVGHTYDDLPLHCTFMFRFWSEQAPDVLAARIKLLFDSARPVSLTPYEHVQLGPRKVGAWLVQKTPEIMNLHMQLHAELAALGAEFTEPQWVGAGYKPHITDRNNETIAPNKPQQCHAAYLIEVIDGRRVARSRFMLPAA